MVHFFFYKKLVHLELLNKISPHYSICDAYIKENNSLQEKKITGKLVKFNMDLDLVINKINQIAELKDNNQYKLRIVSVNTTKDNTTHTSYIFY